MERRSIAHIINEKPPFIKTKDIPDRHTFRLQIFEESGILRISGEGLTHIDDLHLLPNNVKQKIRLLDLSENNIKTIPSRVFKELPNMEILELNGNKIETIEPGAFDNLYNLLWLDLECNKIKRIYKNIFKELKNLKDLYLSYNYIHVIDDDAFNDLQNLECINLTHNGITHMPVNAFKNLPHLKNIYFRLNMLDEEIVTMINNVKKNRYHLRLSTIGRNIDHTAQTDQK